jgi:hypothetical protein
MNITIELSEEQQSRLLQWQSSHAEKYTGALGGRYTFKVTPTSIGNLIKVSDIVTHEELDLTEYPNSTK